MTANLPSSSSPDVAIVGGGVSGSSLAIVLRRRGIAVVLIERGETFRDRIRGETVHPWGTNEMRRLDLYDLAVNGARARPLLLGERPESRDSVAVSLGRRLSGNPEWPRRRSCRTPECPDRRSRPPGYNCTPPRNSLVCPNRRAVRDHSHDC